MSAGIAAARERMYPQKEAESLRLYISSGPLMERLALSYDAVLADAYWIRAIQYYGAGRLATGGGSTAQSKPFELLYPLLDITTSLDPLFSQAYRFGAMFLAEEHPGGAGRPDLAVKLLEKGIQAEPDKWWYYHDAGFVSYWHLSDYKKASEWFRRGAERPGAPWWLETYAAVMLTRGGDRMSSRAMWEQLRQTAENDWLRGTAELRLAQLDALDQIDTLRRSVAEFGRRAGRRPWSWEELIASGLIRGIPADPSGTPYTLIPSTGEVTVAAWSKLHPLPTEPAAAPELKAP